MTEEDSNLGVTLQLPAETIERLRTYHQPPQNNNGAKLEFLTPAGRGNSTSLAQTIASEPNIPADFGSEDDESSEDDGFVNVRASDPDDNWNEVLALPPEDLLAKAEDTPENACQQGDDDSDQEQENANNYSEGEEEEEEEDDDEDDDVLSLSPPPHLPVVWIDIQKIVGYKPSDSEEISQLEHQIRSALWHGSSDAAEAKSGGNPQEDTRENMEQILDAAQHFEDRVTELLDSGLARHATTSDSSPEDEIVVVVSYPEFLCSTQHHDSTVAFAPRQVLETSQIWKRLIRPHPIPVVHSLLTHLQQCNRSLVWKHAMHQELWSLAKEEERARNRRNHQRALKEWKYGKRKQQLDQLYHVRETLEYRYKMAQSKVLELEQSRDQAVSQEMRRRRMESGVGGGLEAFDLNSTILAFPTDETWLGLAAEDDDEDADQVGPSFVSDSEDGSDYSGYDAEGDDISQDGNVADEPEREVQTPAHAAEAVDALHPARRDAKKARRKAAAKKQRKRLEETAKEVEHQCKLDQARAEEARMREMFTTNDLKMAQAIAVTLERKMASVDELLESLQEEEWADEEAEEEGKELIPGEKKDAPKNSDTDFSLLDQVLAMILGSLPPSSKPKDEEALAEHTRKLQEEHSRIVMEWKEYFGRVPPSLQSKEEQQEGLEDQQADLRSAYGIVDNEQDDWEAADSDDEQSNDNDSGDGEGRLQEDNTKVMPSVAPTTTPKPLPPQKLGLRPGGKVQK